MPTVPREAIQIPDTSGSGDPSYSIYSFDPRWSEKPVSPAEGIILTGQWRGIKTKNLRLFPALRCAIITSDCDCQESLHLILNNAPCKS